MSKHLHIVTHDVPWPADFGGVVDLYYKLKWLHAFGAKIHLHCFVKNRPPQEELNKYCDTVHYYERKKAGISFSLPYIVSSRISNELITNLQKDEYPILLEGIHVSYLLHRDLFPHRKIFLRLHNVEFKYYERLAGHESNLLKKIYFKNEARLLKKYERAIANKAPIWAVSSADVELYQTEFAAKYIHFLPVFLPWEDVQIRPGRGEYCLYQGNLSVNENEKAALWLIEDVFSRNSIPFTIAGKSPSGKIKKAAAPYPHIHISEDPSDQNMQELIAGTQVNILPSFNSTGVKLKLLNALFNGRWCLVNLAGCAGSGVNDLCTIAETAGEFNEQLKELYDAPFPEKEMQRRDAALKNLYHNEENARRINAWIW